jgi:hypothetical protein
MDPIEQFEHTLMLATAVWSARALRCLDRAGLLDEESRSSIHGQILLLAEDAEAIPEGDPMLAHLDMLVRILPPRPNG